MYTLICQFETRHHNFTSFYIMGLLFKAMQRLRMKTINAKWGLVWLVNRLFATKILYKLLPWNYNFGRKKNDKLIELKLQFKRRLLYAIICCSANTRSKLSGIKCTCMHAKLFISYTFVSRQRNSKLCKVLYL